MSSRCAAASEAASPGAVAAPTPAAASRRARFAPWVEQELALAGGTRAAAAHATAVGAAAALQTSLWHAERATFAAMHVQLSRSYFRADLSAEQVLTWHVRPLVRPLLRFDSIAESGPGAAASAASARGAKGDAVAAAASVFIDAPFSAAFEVRRLSSLPSSLRRVALAVVRSRAQRSAPYPHTPLTWDALFFYAFFFFTLCFFFFILRSR